MFSRFLMLVLVTTPSVAIARESLADYFEARKDKPVELFWASGSKWVSTTIVAVGSDYVCFDGKVNPDSPEGTKCYPFSAINRIMERADKLLVDPALF